MTIRYNGTIRGDTINGTTRFGTADNTGDLDSFWAAKRSK